MVTKKEDPKGVGNQMAALRKEVTKFNERAKTTLYVRHVSGSRFEVFTTGPDVGRTVVVGGYSKILLYLDAMAIGVAEVQAARRKSTNEEAETLKRQRNNRQRAALEIVEEMRDIIRKQFPEQPPAEAQPLERRIKALPPGEAAMYFEEVERELRTKMLTEFFL